MTRSECPWCAGFELIPPHPEKVLCIKHLKAFARMFPSRVKRPAR